MRLDVSIEEEETLVKKRVASEDMSRGAKKSLVEISSGAYCRVFAATTTTNPTGSGSESEEEKGGEVVHKIMYADNSEGLGHGTVRECNFYCRLPSNIVPEFLSGTVLSVDPNPDSDYAWSFLVDLEMPRMQNDMWAIVFKQDSSLTKWNRKIMALELPKLVDHITLALSRLHASGLLHRDIKPPNIVTDGLKYYLIDFGSSNSAKVSTRTGGNCSYGFCAPEAGPSRKGTIDTVESDIYSFAATVLALILNYMPDCHHLFDWAEFATDKKNLIKWPQCAILWKSVLIKAVDKNPHHRPTLQEIRKAFQLEEAPSMGQPLPFKTWPVVKQQELDKVMAGKVTNWPIKKHKLVDWLAKVVREKKWSKYTFMTTVQILYEVLMSNLVKTVDDLQLVGVTALLMTSTCFEDCVPDLEIFSWLTGDQFSVKDIFLCQQKMFVFLEYVIIRRPILIDFESMSFPNLVKFVLENDV